MSKTPTIKETVVAQVDKTDLDAIVQDELLGLSIDGHDYNWLPDTESTLRYWREGEYIGVEMLQQVISDLKVFGTTHIQIYSHGDHRGYYFTGVKLEVLDEKEALERKKKALEESIKYGEIALRHEEDELDRKKKVLEERKEELEGLK